MIDKSELYSFCSMNMQFNSLRDYAASLKLITFEVFLFQMVGNCNSAMSENIHNIGPHAVASLSAQF